MKIRILLPGKEPRVIENSNIELIEKRVKELGGTIEVVVEPKIEEKITKTLDAWKKNIVPFSSLSVYNRPTMSEAEGMEVVRSIQRKYFPELDDVRIYFQGRAKNRLGSAWYRLKKIKLNRDLLDSRKHYLNQVIYHELCHIEFPGGHRVPGFRRKEFNNPFRTKKTNRLTCVS
jgi:predicted metal-dependent hydrolase